MAFKDYILSISDKRTTERTMMLTKIAEECGVNLSTVYKWVNGQSVPDKLKREKIASLTGKTVEELFNLKENEQ
jgi:Helix-turn-helix.